MPACLQAAAAAAREQRGVCISTIHAAKGLEWDACFVPHFVEGMLPMAHREMRCQNLFIHTQNPSHQLCVAV